MTTLHTAQQALRPSRQAEINTRHGRADAEDVTLACGDVVNDGLEVTLASDSHHMH